MSDTTPIDRDSTSATVADSGSSFHVDPTRLTTQLVWREVAALKELVLTKIHAMEVAIRVAHDDLVRVPTDVQKQVGSLKDLHDEVIQGLRAVLETRLGGTDRAIGVLQTSIDQKISALQGVQQEKFDSIQTQFRERDTRIDQQSKDSKVAVEAAFQAAKEAVGEQTKSFAMATAKAETATVKQIDQQAQLITTATKALDDKISDVKDRLTKLEGMAQGVATHKSDSTVNNNFIIAVIGVLIGLGGFIFAVTRGLP